MKVALALVLVLSGCAAGRPKTVTNAPSVAGVRQSVTDAGNDVREAQGATGEARGLGEQIDSNLQHALEQMP